MNDAAEGPRVEAIGYTEAMAELESILEEMEADSVDVDVLSAKVERAAQLIRVCRERISAAAVRVEEIVADLDAPPERGDG